MHATKIVLGRGSVSTHHGQQRILKHSTPNLVTYIQKAVQTGIYRSNAEIEEMNQRLQENPSDLKRVRWHVPRGSHIQDYPKEYEILTLHPPSPFRPKMPLKDQRKAMNQYLQEHRPTDRLARAYLARQQATRTTTTTTTTTTTRSSGEPATAEEYYERLLGANKAPKIYSAMGAKSAIVNKAYAFAVKQHQLMRTEQLSETDALARVEELLQEQDGDERTASRNKAETLAAQKETVRSSSHAKERAETVFPRPKMQRPKNKQEDQDDSDLAILYSNPQRAFEGMISWTHKLQAVPYRQWTVGASVALDHWIAKRVLGLSEETWLELLEGDSPELMSRGRDIVLARQALFPETILEEEAVARQQNDEDPNDKKKSSTSDALDAILLGLGMDNWDDDSKSMSRKQSLSDTKNDDDNKILQLTEQLQEWRAKQVDSPYENWSPDDQQSFQNWLQDYILTFTPESALGQVDMEGTRRALLALPPQSPQDSDHFWNAIRDETAAEVFLQRMLAAKNNDDSSSHPFWQLEYSTQVQRLVELGSIRDIADEYASDQDRGRFLARYGDYLMEGVELDHLVPDPQGPIRGSDLGDRLRDHHGIGPNDRFRLEQLTYGTDEFGTDAAQRARELYRAWNLFKAGRAHYEEKLFQRGLLGVTYDAKDRKSN